ncbi:MAG TPA: hypothetical protein VGN34_13285, partial [Ktedonobacteraceae bacterium]
MENEGMQSPQPEQGPGKQSGYGWQYDQDDGGEISQRVSPSSSGSLRALSSLPPAQTQRSADNDSNSIDSASSQIQQERQLPLPASYQEPLYDMGTSLGYGQGMEYQYFDAPQPTQPMAQLRQERLQQVREERMRRQQRRIKSDITTLISGKKKAEPPLNDDTLSASVPVPPAIRQSTLPQEIHMGTSGAEAVVQLSPSPVPEPQQANGHARSYLQPAAQSVQDTGMIQKVRVGRAAVILTSAFVASRMLGLVRTSMFA